MTVSSSEQTAGSETPSLHSLLQQGRSEHRKGNLSQAMAFYQAAMQQDPAQAEPHNLLGLAALQVGDHQIAVELFRTAATLEESPEHLCNLGVGVFMLQSFQEAEDLFERVLESAPDHLEALSSLGMLLEQQGRFTEAEEVLEQASQAAPEEANILGKLAECCYRLGKLDQAQAAAEHALNYDPRECTALYALARTYERMGHTQAAIRHLETLEQLEPHVPEHGQLLDSLREASSPAH